MYKNNYNDKCVKKEDDKNVDLLEPVTKKFITDLQAQNTPPLYEMSVSDARNVLEKIQSQPSKQPLAQIQDLMISDSKESDYNNNFISIRIVRPLTYKNDTAPLPVLLYFHGGGWILGSKYTHNRLVSELSNGIGCAVVFVNYTPSPEAKFPTAIQQGYFVAQYITENGIQMNLDPNRIAIAGDSAGGQIATAIAILAKKLNGPKFMFQALFYPVTDSSMNTPSYETYKDGPWLTKKAMEWFWNAYKPSPNIGFGDSILMSPLKASLEDLAGLPPTLIITDDDVLRDEGEAYAHQLIKAGNKVVAIRYLGTIHDFMMLNPLKNTPATRSAIQLAITNLRNAFAK